MTKRSLVLLLIGLNVALFTALSVTVWDLPRAEAQPDLSTQQQYLMATAQISRDHDGLFVINPRTRIMYLFDQERSSKQVAYITLTDLAHDIRQGSEPKLEGQQYMMVAPRAGRTHDTLFIIENKSRNVHLLNVNRSARGLTLDHLGQRSLEHDLRPR